MGVTKPRAAALDVLRFLGGVLVWSLFLRLFEVIAVSLAALGLSFGDGSSTPAQVALVVLCLSVAIGIGVAMGWLCAWTARRFGVGWPASLPALFVAAALLLVPSAFKVPVLRTLQSVPTVVLLVVPLYVGRIVGARRPRIEVPPECPLETSASESAETGSE